MSGYILGKKTKLRTKTLDDARNDYQWQSDPELAGLDATPVLTLSFPQYLTEYAKMLRLPSARRQLFAVETFNGGRHIGNCTYYGVDVIRGEAEVGIMIGDRDCWDRGYGSDAVSTLVSYIFHHTEVKRLHLKTLHSNSRAQKCFQKCGFTPCGTMSRSGYNFVLMELYRQDWSVKFPDQSQGGTK
ncbi:MAG: GNAT family N-acetyltransferase [Chloroflexota bacterium]